MNSVTASQRSFEVVELHSPQESRPVVSHEAAKSFGGDKADSTCTHRKTWARALIDKASGPIAPYGSPQWVALPLDHPNRIAAVVVAAEAWAWDWEHLEESIRREVEELRAQFKRSEDVEYAQQMAEHRRRTEGLSRQRLSTFEERRAAQLKAAKPRSTDFQGRPKPVGGDSA